MLISRRNSGVRDHEHATRVRDTRRQERALTGEQVQLADEPTRAVGRDDFVVFGTRADDLDLTLEHHEEVFDEVARSEQQVTDGNRTLDTELPELVELRRTERHPCRVAGNGREGSRRCFLGCHGDLLRLPDNSVEDRKSRARANPAAQSQPSSASPSSGHGPTAIGWQLP